MRRRKRHPKKSALIPIPGSMVMSDLPIVSRAMAVHPKQVEAANEHAQRLGVGRPFGTDGILRLSRSQMKRYIEGINRHRPEGQERIVNFDGGYGDPT